MRTIETPYTQSRIGGWVFGGIWGALLGFSAIFGNLNYEHYIRGAGEPPIWFIGIIAFFILSVAVLALMIFSGLLLALFGRKSPNRWKTIGGVVGGFGLITPLMSALVSAK